jgi:hypothetical protein
MTRKLNEADRAAVDLMFDRLNAAQNGGANGNGNGGGDGVVAMASAVADERLGAVQRILSTLDMMPAPEPSSDLVIRTLQRVARETRSGTTTGPTALPGHGMGAVIDPNQPMA